MKKNIMSFFVIAIAITSCNSNDDQIDEQNNPITEAPKKLKSIISNNSAFIYEYGANGFVETEIVNYVENDEIVGEIKYVYNDQNQIIASNQENKNKYPDGTYKDFESKATYTYTNGLVTASVREMGNVGEIYTTIETTYFYNSDEKIIREEEKITYDSNVNYVHTFHYYEAGVLKYSERKAWENGSYSSNFERTDYGFDTKINPEYYLYPKSYSILSPYTNINNLLSLTNDKVPAGNFTVTIDYKTDNTPEKVIKTFGTGFVQTLDYEYKE